MPNEAPPLALVTFPDFVRMSARLAEQLQKDHGQDPFDLIVSINRGGAVLSRILSDFLEVPIGAFSVSSYAGVNQQKRLSIPQTLNLYLTDKKVLLVDEICDSGNTFLAAVHHVQQLSPRQVLTCTIFTKPHSIFAPDYSIESTHKWVVFPYEVRETLRGLKPFFEKNEAMKTQVMNYFLETGVEKKLILKLLESI